MRDRFMASIMSKSALLEPNELAFLQKLGSADQDGISVEHLNQAINVLEKDPLYQSTPTNERRQRSEDDKAQQVRASLRVSVCRPVVEEKEEELKEENKLKPSSDQSFRKEIWNEYWQSWSSRQTLVSQASTSADANEEHDTDKHHRRKKNNGVVNFFQKVFFIPHRKVEEENDDAENDAVLESDIVQEAPFSVLGATPDDEIMLSMMVLTPPIMDALRPNLPYACQQDNFWLKYSMIRNGASLETLLRCVRGSARTILAIETMDGDVLGSFTSSPWRVNGHAYYGSGEAFLWRLSKSRLTYCQDCQQQKQLESEIEVYGWSGMNRNVQLLPTHDSDLALGGGPPDGPLNDSSPEDSRNNDKYWGFGLVLANDLSRGSSEFSVTFNNPALPTTSKEVFEVANVEVWTLTPVEDEKQAEMLEMSRQFVFDHGNFIEA